MKRHLYLAAAMTALLIAGGAGAQPADLPIPAATTTELPPGVSVKQTKSGGRVYVDSKGRTLYGMDMRTLVRWTTTPTKYCPETCAAQWEPLLAPADAKPNPLFTQPQGGFGGGGGGGGGNAVAGIGQQSGGAPIVGQRPGGGAPGAAPGGGAPGAGGPGGAQAIGAQIQQVNGPQAQGGVPDWSIAEGVNGPQWVYKRWHVVFVRKGDKPGSTAFDGAEEMTWNTLKYIPPVPTLVAPTNVSTVVVDGDYALADKEGRVLFTGKPGSANWTPFVAGLATRGVGEWSVNRSGDASQWVYRGKPVFVSQEAVPTETPAAGSVLRP